MRSDDRKRKPGDNTIVYHFDIKRHSMPLDQFIDTALATKSIIETFNKQWLGGKLNYELRIAPPEHGGVIETIKLVIKDKRLVIASVLALCSSKTRGEFLAGIVKKISGKNPTQLGEDIAGKLEEWALEEEEQLLLEEIQKEEASPPDAMMLEGPPTDTGARPQSEDSTEGLAEAIIAESVAQFLEEAPEKLEQSGLPMKKFQQAYEAKNRVLQACTDNPEVNGLGFSQSDDFPIQRNDFERLQAVIPEADEQETKEGPLPQVDITTVTVNSPNWEPDRKRGWQGRAYDEKLISFEVHDANFWLQVKDKKVKPEIRDLMKVQWVYAETSGRLSHVRALKVLSFNGKEISKPLRGKALEEELGKHEMRITTKEKNEEKNMDLFEDWHVIEEKSEDAQQIHITEE